MIHDIYQMTHEPEVTDVLEEMRKKIANSKEFGVTLVGDRLTLRWSKAANGVKPHEYVGYEGTCLDCNKGLEDPIHASDLKQVHMIIVEVRDGFPEDEIIPK